MTEEHPPGRLSDLDDERLLAALREILGAADPPPPWCADLAKDSLGLRMADAELAALVDDSPAVSVTRGASVQASAAPWLAAFDAGSLSVEIEVSPGPQAASWQLVGQLLPPVAATVRIRRRLDDQASVAADDLGRFIIDRLPPGPLSLAIEIDGRRPVITDWVSLG